MQLRETFTATFWVKRDASQVAGWNYMVAAGELKWAVIYNTDQKGYIYTRAGGTWERLLFGLAIFNFVGSPPPNIKMTTLRRIFPLYLLLALLITGCTLLKSQTKKPIVGSERSLPRSVVSQKHVKAGDVAYKNNNISKAIEEYKAALDTAKDDSAVLFKLAKAYTRKKEYALAIASFQDGLKIDPKNIGAHNYLGYAYEQSKQYQQAATEYETVLEFEQENLYALSHLGLAYRQMKKLDKAEVILRTALELDPKCERPDSKNVHNYLGLVYEGRGDIGAAIAEYRESIRLFPKELWARKHLAGLLEEKGQYYEALLEHFEILKIDPKNAHATSRINALEPFTSANAVAHVEPVNIIEDDIEKLIKNAPERSKYPDADSLILLNKFSHDVLSDGRARLTIHCLIKIFTERGIQDNGEVAIPFNVRAQNIEINIAKAILPDGSEINAPEDAFNDVTPPGLLTHKLFSDTMWKVVSMPALQKGAIIEYQATVEDAKLQGAESKGWFWGGMSFQTTSPILMSKYLLRMPKDLKFKWKTYNCNLEPVILDKGETTIYSWTYGETKAIQPEIGMASLEDIIPKLSYSSVTSWDEVAEWYNDLAKDRYEADDEIKALAEKLTANLTERENKIKAIYHFVASRIRYVGIEYGVGAYQPKDAKDVLKYRYGDCKDKTTLMMSMLRCLGIEAFPVMINVFPHEKIDLDLPSPGQFNHVIGVCERRKESQPAAQGFDTLRTQPKDSILANAPNPDYIWLDTTAETCNFGYLPVSDQGKTVFVITDKGGKFTKTPTYPPNSNKVSIESFISVNADGSVFGKERMLTSGEYNMTYRRLYKSLNPRETQNFFATALNHQYPGVKIENISISDLFDMDTPVETAIEFLSPDYCLSLNDRLLFAMPDDNLASYASLVGPAERKFDLFLGFPMQFSKKTSISTPDGYKTSTLPPDISLEHDFGSFKRSYKKLNDNTIKYEMCLTLTQSIVSAKQYQELKEFLETIAREDKTQIVLEKAGGSPKSL